MNALERRSALSAHPSPAFYKPENAGLWGYHPNAAIVFDEAARWRKLHATPFASRDEKRVRLLLIDPQQDFSLKKGSLYVGGRSGEGAIEDSARIAEFIYRNLSAITRITTTMDTHVAFQIFFPSFWEKADGSPAGPFTSITSAELDAGAYRVSPSAASALGEDHAALTRHVRHYCAELERTKKYPFIIWPFHCLVGSDGHAIVGVIEEAAMFHAFARGAPLIPEQKGDHPLTEHYSVFRPEVLARDDGARIGEENIRLIEALLDADRLVIAGQAASHCVKSSIDDLLAWILRRDPSLASKVYILEDCMSSVTVPNGDGGFIADFTPQTEAALQAYRAAGMNVVRSTDPIESWPSF